MTRKRKSAKPRKSKPPKQKNGGWWLRVEIPPGQVRAYLRKAKRK